MLKIFYKIIWEVDLIRKDIDPNGEDPQRFYFWFRRSARKFAEQVAKTKNYSCSWGGEPLRFNCGKFEFPEDD